MSASLERAVYDTARDLVEALQEQTVAINRMSDQIQEIWRSLDNIHKQIEQANNMVKELKY